MRAALEKYEYALTNGVVDGKEVYLGCNDSPENWREIDDAEVPPVESVEDAVSV